MHYSPIKKPDSKVTRHWPIALILLGVALMFTILGALLVNWMKLHKPAGSDLHAEVYTPAQRDFQQIPFDMLDATHYCETHTRNRYGEELALTYVDEHSTRFDADKGLYKVFMVAHIGSLSEYKKTAIYCFVDKYRYKVTHYRAIDGKDNSVFSHAKRLFGR